MKEKKKKKITSENFKLKPFLVSTLRASYKKTPMYREALEAAKEEYFETSKNGKPLRRVRYRCANCNRKFREYLEVPAGGTPSDVGLILDPKSKQNAKKKFKMIAVDHVDPIIDPDIGFTTWDDYIMKHYFGKAQVLCNYPGKMDGMESCHHLKTRAERDILNETKRKKKKDGQ